MGDAHTREMREVKTERDEKGVVCLSVTHLFGLQSSLNKGHFTFSNILLTKNKLPGPRGVVRFELLALVLEKIAIAGFATATTTSAPPGAVVGLPASSRLPSLLLSLLPGSDSTLYSLVSCLAFDFSVQKMFSVPREGPLLSSNEEEQIRGGWSRAAAFDVVAVGLPRQQQSEGQR